MLFTRGPGTYKIPAFNDVPQDFRVYLADTENPVAVHSSKAIGEPPFFLGASVFFAIKVHILVLLVMMSVFSMWMMFLCVVNALCWLDMKYIVLNVFFVFIISFSLSHTLYLIISFSSSRSRCRRPSTLHVPPLPQSPTRLTCHWTCPRPPNAFAWPASMNSLHSASLEVSRRLLTSVRRVPGKVSAQGTKPTSSQDRATTTVDSFAEEEMWLFIRHICRMNENNPGGTLQSIEPKLFY